jgi:hypothetical protein
MTLPTGEESIWAGYKRKFQLTQIKIMLFSPSDNGNSQFIFIPSIRIQGKLMPYSIWFQSK